MLFSIVRARTLGGLLLLLCLAQPLAAESESAARPVLSESPPSHALPDEVAAALAEGDCAQLVRLNRRYWRALDNGESTEQTRRAARALEAHILAQPLCGRASGELLQVQPFSGVNFFDQRDPAGQGARP